MRGKEIITVPEGVNPGGFLTFEKVEELFGIEEKTLRSWRSRQSRNGFPSFKVEGRVFVRCDEFCAWLNLVAVEVDVRNISFASDSKVRGKAAPASRNFTSFIRSNPASRLRAGAGSI